MKRTDIDKRFTQEVVSYIALGYTIHTGSMNGSQGETAKVDLVKGNDRIRIYLDDYGSDYDLGYNVTTLVVGRVPEEDWERTVWNNHLEVIYTEKWYQLGHRKDYYVTRKEAEAAREKRDSRWETYRRDRFYNKSVNLTQYAPVVVDFVRRQKNCKRVKLGDISKVYKESRDGKKYTYYVVAKNHTFKLA